MDNNNNVFEYHPQHTTPFDPTAVVAACFENDAHALLLEESVLPAEFFDLSTGVAGELLQRLSLYGIRTGAVVADPSQYSRPFQDFLLEANRGKQVRFFQRREDAVRWLESA